MDSAARSPPCAASARAFNSGRVSLPACASNESSDRHSRIRLTARILFLLGVLARVARIDRYQPMPGLPFLVGHFAAVRGQKLTVIFHRLGGNFQVIVRGSP